MATTDLLSSNVIVSRQFLRSINLEADLGRKDALNGYICQNTTRSLIENMAHQLNGSQQRAFTWTGPYGTGKSSLALILAALVTPSLKQQAKRILHIQENDEIDTAFKSTEKGWIVLPVVGKRESVIATISKAIDKFTGETTRRPSASNVISRLLDIATEEKNDGVLLIIDELGKFLESAAINGEDIYFYQELAEAASRSDKKIVIVGILHQAFDQYAIKLGREAREEWSKVQGRYIDIPLMVATDEIVELIGRSLEKKNIPNNLIQFKKINDVVCDLIEKRRPNSPAGIKESLFNCWPLHPVTAVLLGIISRKKFSQNERSIFGFLASAEPLGFKSFLEAIPYDELSLYSPWHLWDYLKFNLEQSILASTDGHRWAVANDAIERTESREGCTVLHVQLAKTVAIMDLFKAGSGLIADDKVLDISVDEPNKDSVRNAIQDLARWSIIVFRKHLNAWAIYSGSDFDIESAVNLARNEIDRLNINKLVELCELNPVVAKRHYHETGSLRWFSRSLINIETSEEYLSKYQPIGGAIGEFVLMTPSEESSLKQNDRHLQKLSESSTKYPIVIGLAANSEQLFELGMELTALESVYKSRRELDGDPVARKEINTRIAVLKIELSDELKKSFDNCNWYYKGQPVSASKGKLSTIASNLVDENYYQTPRIHNELVNKDYPSSTAVKARRELMYKMVRSSHLDKLGYEGFSADAGLYYSILLASNLHQLVGDSYSFVLPSDEEDVNKLRPLWNAADNLFKKSHDAVTLAELYEVWHAPPQGLKKGVAPILALAYFLANEHQLCLYIENTYIPELTEAYIDELMQDPGRVALKYIQIGQNSEHFLKSLSFSLSKTLGKQISPNPLDSARGLVQLVVSLPNWTKRTMSISDNAQIFRKTILQARDPYKVLFSDLPELLRAENEDQLVEKISSLSNELQSQYPTMIESLKKAFFKAIDHREEDGLAPLRARAKAIKSKSGDFKVDAFIAHVSELENDLEDFEGLFSTTINKRPSEWVDRDQEAALNEIVIFCSHFRKIEALNNLRGQSSSRKSFAFVFLDPENPCISENFDVSNEKLSELTTISEEILKGLTNRGFSCDEIMAIFAQACQKTIGEK
jgi:hypothetical protein